MLKLFSEFIFLNFIIQPSYYCFSINFSVMDNFSKLQLSSQEPLTDMQMCQQFILCVLDSVCIFSCHKSSCLHSHFISILLGCLLMPVLGH